MRVDRRGNVEMRYKKIHRFARPSLDKNTKWVLMIVLTVIGIGCSGSETTEQERRVVYICRETKKLVVAALQPTPAVNPATGRKTLIRALYCPRCKKWRAIPTDSAVNGNPLATKCPKHKCAMTADGPFPE